MIEPDPQRIIEYMDTNFSPRVKDVIAFSREEALRLGHDYIGTEHFLLGLIREGEGVAIKILQNLNVDLAEVRRSVEDSIQPLANKSTSVSNGNIPLVKQLSSNIYLSKISLELELALNPQLIPSHVLCMVIMTVLFQEMHLL